MMMGEECFMCQYEYEEIKVYFGVFGLWEDWVDLLVWVYCEFVDGQDCNGEEYLLCDVCWVLDMVNWCGLFWKIFKYVVFKCCFIVIIIVCQYFCEIIKVGIKLLVDVGYLLEELDYLVIYLVFNLDVCEEFGMYLMIVVFKCEVIY